jgi:hypothetical protein
MLLSTCRRISRRDRRWLAFKNVRAQNIHNQREGHESNSKEQRPLRHDIVISGFTFKARPDSTAARHCVALSRDQYKCGKKDRNENADADEDVIKIEQNELVELRYYLSEDGKVKSVADPRTDRRNQAATNQDIRESAVPNSLTDVRIATFG